MKYYLIAGEASGDLHGSALMAQIKKVDAAAEFRFWGGDEMQQQGGTLVKHIKDLAFMGFVEVLKNIVTITNNLRLCKSDIAAYKPHVIIFIDYPGFNMRIAKWAKENYFKTAYYISPQIWAWKESRVHNIKRDIDLMLCILPFEQEFYLRHNHKVFYVGHPLVKRIQQYKQAHIKRSTNKQIIALLPGSRLQEIENKLPVMLSVVQYFPQYQFVVAQSPTIDDSVYTAHTKYFNNVGLVKGATYDILNNAHAALVTSGTATLETALFKVPQVVCYKASDISYHIAKRLIKVKYISLVNLIAQRQVVTELIQDEFNTQNLKQALSNILLDDVRHNMLQDYNLLEQSLNEPQNQVSAAQKIIELAGK